MIYCGRYVVFRCERRAEAFTYVLLVMNWDVK